MNIPDPLRADADAWIGIAETFAAQDGPAVADLLVPPGLPPDQLWNRLAKIVLLGATLTADFVTRANGHAIGRVPAGYRYVLAGDPRREGTAAERVVGEVVTAAVAGDFRLVVYLLVGYSGDGHGAMQRLVDVALALLSVYVRLDAGRRADAS